MNGELWQMRSSVINDQENSSEQSAWRRHWSLCASAPMGEGKAAKIDDKLFFHLTPRRIHASTVTSAPKTLRPYRNWQKRPANLPRFTIKRFPFFFELSWAKVRRLNGEKHRTGLIKFRLMLPTLLNLHNRVSIENSTLKGLPIVCLRKIDSFLSADWTIAKKG